MFNHKYLSWHSGALLTMACMLAACGGGGSDSPEPAPDMRYPVTQVGDEASVHFGQRVADPYRWLEDIRSTPVIDWVRAQNAFSAAHVEGLPAYQPLLQRLTQLQDYETEQLKRGAQGLLGRDGQYQEGQQVQGRYYYQWQRMEQTQHGLRRLPQTARGRSVDNRIYVSAGQGLVGQLLVDVGVQARSEPDDAIELLGHQLSANGRYLAYRLKRNHADLDELHLIDLGSGLQSPTVLSQTVAGGFGFEGEHLLYVEALNIEQVERSSYGVQAIQRIALADLRGSKQTLYRSGGELPQASLGLLPVVDGQLYIEQGTTTATSDLLRLDLRTANAKAQKVLDGQGRDSFELVGEDRAFPGRLLVKTSHGSAMMRLVSIDPEQPQGGVWRHILPVQASDVVQDIRICGAHAYAKQGFGGASRLTRYAMDGASAPQAIPLPMQGSVPAMRCDEEDGLRFQLSSLVLPHQVVRYEPVGGRVEVMTKTVYAGHDPQRYETYPLLVPASDGSQIPVTIAHRKGLVRDGSAPALMYVYGGFNVSLDAAFSPEIVPLLESGGIYLIAHVRGGAEQGLAWYDAGRLQHKSRTYADLADVARYLAAQGYTRADRMGVTGGSNGGTSSAAAALLYPELFAVALPKVGVHDLTRYPLFTQGFQWLSDYGDPTVGSEFSNLMGFSPLHNVKARRYPAMYVITGQNDQRVLPAHSYKLAATLQKTATGPGPYLLHAFDKSGHQVEGGGARLQAHELAFFFAYTGTVFTQQAVR
jgi:prolyl oligopeptidase